MIIDATNLVLGRFATVAAKKALLGETVNVVNCEKAIITGTKARIIADFKRKITIGIPLKGPYYPKQSDRIVRRTIRGMLPHKKTRGREAFKKVMCYIGVPEKFASQKLETVDNADVSRLSNLKYMHLKDIVKEIGGKI
ncbi:MAG: 50S ribosomal protein L13 [Candidatus Woesearchaeota archaeon]